MAVSAAPACKAALAEATRLWPKRSTASDGILPSAAHSIQNPKSDHELGNAFDLTNDPAVGCNAHDLAEAIRLRNDARVKYVISARRIWTPAISRTWRPYTGSNPHTSHIHVSIHATARNSTGLWFPAATPKSEPAQPTSRTLNVHIHLEDRVKTHDRLEHLDQNGNAQWFSDLPFVKFVSLEACHPKRPYADGGYLPGLMAQPVEDDGKIVVVVTGGQPSGTARVLLTVAD